MRLLSLAIMTAFLAAPLAAADKDQDPAAPKKEKRVCREETPTGSHVPRRSCHTQSEWAKIDKEQQENADREVGRISSMGRGDGSGFNPN